MRKLFCGPRYGVDNYWNSNFFAKDPLADISLISIALRLLLLSKSMAVNTIQLKEKKPTKAAITI